MLAQLKTKVQLMMMMKMNFGTIGKMELLSDKMFLQPQVIFTNPSEVMLTHFTTVT